MNEAETFIFYLFPPTDHYQMWQVPCQWYMSLSRREIESFAHRPNLQPNTSGRVTAVQRSAESAEMSPSIWYVYCYVCGVCMYNIKAWCGRAHTEFSKNGIPKITYIRVWCKWAKYFQPTGFIHWRIIILNLFVFVSSLFDVTTAVVVGVSYVPDAPIRLLSSRDTTNQCESATTATLTVPQTPPFKLMMLYPTSPHSIHKMNLTPPSLH